MTAPQNAFADLLETTQRGQAAATDAYRSWVTAVETLRDAAGPQASSVRRLVGGLFDLADQAVEVQRELATFLAVNARVTAATLDSFRKLSDSATGALEDAARAVTATR